MKEIMAIFDSDRMYAENLSAKLANQEDFPYYTVCFSCKEEFLQYREEQEISILLMDQKSSCQEIDREFLMTLPESPGKDPPLLLYLTEARGYSKIGDVPAIYKYQSILVIEDELLRAIDSSRKRVVKTNRYELRTYYIGVAGPIGRTLKTSFCLTMGQLLSQNARVLLVSLEMCSGYSAMFDREFGMNLSDILYAYQTGRNDWKVEDFVEKFHGLDFLAPVSMPEDVYRTDPVQVRKLLMEVAERGRYDIVLIDLAVDYRHLECLLPLCRKLYLSSRKDVVSEAKMKEFREWIERICPEEERPEVEVLCLPNYQPFSSGKNYLEQLLWSGMGDYVRNLLGGMY